MSWVEDNLLVPGEIVHYEARAWGGWEYVITSRRLIAVKSKVFGKDVSEINLANVEYVEAKKGFLILRRKNIHRELQRKSRHDIRPCPAGDGFSAGVAGSR